MTPSTGPIFEVRMNQKNLENLPRRNTRKGTGTKGRPVSWVWIFSLGKKVKKSFKVLSTGLQYLVCGCTMITFLFVPKFWNVHSSYFRNLQIFPEVDLDYRHVNVEKFTGRSLFEKHTSNFERSREVNFWIFFSNNILTIIKPRNRTRTTRKTRKDGCTELQETVMPGVKTVIRWYNIMSTCVWSEHPA
jgi:hypothetical protein